MDNYLTTFREMLSLRDLFDHTLKGYCTYIRAYLDYLHTVLHKLPEDVSRQEMRELVRWLQKERSLADRTMNCAISQLRFFTIYVLHKAWDDFRLPMRRFDEYLPYVPSRQEVWRNWGKRTWTLRQSAGAARNTRRLCWQPWQITRRWQNLWRSIWAVTNIRAV